MVSNGRINLQGSYPLPTYLVARGAGPGRPSLYKLHVEPLLYNTVRPKGNEPHRSGGGEAGADSKHLVSIKE